MSEPEVEIRVHFAAPSRAQDDTLYRELATAYLDFEPAQSTNIFPSSSAYEEQQNEVAVDLPLAPPAISSPELSFRSVWDNNGSLPPVQPPSQARIEVPSSLPEPSSSQSSWAPAPSVIEDSQPDANVSVTRFCDSERIFEQVLRALNSSPSRRGSSSQDLPAKTPAEEAAAAIAPAPVLPPLNSSPPQPTTSASLADHPGSAAQEMPARTPVAAAATEPAPVLSSEDVSPPPPQATALEPDTTVSSSPSRLFDIGSSQVITETETFLTTVIPEPDHPSASKRRRIQPSQSRSHRPRISSRGGASGADLRTNPEPVVHIPRSLLGDDGLSIFSPAPPVSCDDLSPDDLITPKLRDLAKVLNLTRRYSLKRTLLQGREPEPLERGCWRLDCSGYQPELKPRAWAFLAAYIVSGDAGWNVWIKRDASFDTIWLYCFGHVAGHMFLLLYTATTRCIHEHDCTWTSPAGELVFVRATKGVAR